MKIKTDELKYVADLARIELNAKETTLLAEQLNNILTYIEKLNQLDTKAVEPLSHALDIANVSRKDTVKKSLGTQEALKNAPSSDNGFFKVPKVIESEA